MMVRRLALGLVLLFGFLFVAIQLVPYGRAHENPAAVQEPAWDSPRTRELAVRACFDCHSNETAWPWYSNVAPASWFVQDHVEEGRNKLNFSRWDQPQREAREAARQVQEGEMPPAYYTPLHGSAQLSASERDELIRGLQATLGGGSPQR
jgi:mono/diheme cytochrome c family protein